jgi:hypothetical protein
MAARAAVQVVLSDIRRRIWHDSKRFHVLGNLILSSGDYATEVTVGDLLLASGEFRDITVITDNLNLTVGAAFSDNANDLAPKRFKPADTVALTGTINVTASASVVGVGTRFLTEIKVNDFLVIGSATAGEARKVTVVTDDLNLTVDAAFTNLADDTAPLKVVAANMVQISGTIDPAAAAAVVGVNTKFLGYGLPFSLNVSGFPGGNKILAMSIRSTRNGFSYAYVRRPTRATLTGTVDTTASTAVVGVGTLFTKELRVGDEILIGIEQRFVTVITDDLNLTVNRAHTDQANDTIIEKIVHSDALADANLAIFVAGVQLTTTAVPVANVDDSIEFEAILAAA